MGLLNIFNKSKAQSPPQLPSGSYTVDREGKVVTRTIPSSVATHSLEMISAQVLQTFREARQAKLNISEFSINMGAMSVKARELRGGAMIFLTPRGIARK